MDQDAAGYGWFTGASPASDPAFGHRAADDESRADAASPASSQVDLLTLLMHEMGHVVGLDDLDARVHPHALMTESLATGVRRYPAGIDPNPDIDVPASQSLGGLYTVAQPMPFRADAARAEPVLGRARTVPVVTMDDAIVTGRVDQEIRPNVQGFHRHTPTPVVGDADGADSIPDDLIADLDDLGQRRRAELGHRGDW